MDWRVRVLWHSDVCMWALSVHASSVHGWVECVIFRGVIWVRVIVLWHSAACVWAPSLMTDGISPYEQCAQVVGLSVGFLE